MTDKKISEILNQLGEDKFSFKPISPPIYQTSNFFFDSFQELKTALAHEAESHIYTRGNNPTVEVVEEKIAALEGGEKAKLFASGVAAISAAIMAFLKTGDHVVCIKDCYSWTNRLFERYLKRFGIQVTFVRGIEVEEWENAIRENTRILYLESPTTFSFELQDLSAIARLASSKNIKTIIDNSWSTPCFQNPIEFGIDLVVHSCSKYIGGHSDVVGGVVVGRKSDLTHIFNTEFLNMGAVPSPVASWLLLRGLRTLPIRMERHYKTAMEVINFLENHDKISEIYYPLHPSHPQYELATRQMSGGSGLFSFRLKTNQLNKVIRFTNALKQFRIAVSWGGYESLVIPIAATGITDPEKIGIVRLHIGLEDGEILIEDLEQALEKI